MMRKAVCCLGWLVCSVAIAEPAFILLGLLVNDQEQASIDALYENDRYYLSLAQLSDALGLSPILLDGQWQFDTPIGQSNIAQDEVYHYAQQDYFPLSSLKALGVTALFDQPDYAIKVYLPWQPGSASRASSLDKAPEPAIDYYPERLGLSNLRIDGEVRHQHQWHERLDIGASGYALGGLWGADADVVRPLAGEKALRVNNLYWTTEGEHYAFRVGSNAASFDAGAATDFTGVSVAYSNREITRHLSAADAHSKTLLQSSYQDYRNIRGRGPAGGIAELRVNGQPVARVRIALDERYEFNNLDVSQLDLEHNQVEVALYEYSLSAEPLSVEPYRLGRRRANVASGEWLLEVGGGALDNLLLPERRDGHYGYLYSEYGLGNHVALRGALSHDGQSAHLFGANIAAGDHINIDLAYWHHGARRQYTGQIDYVLPSLNLSYRYSDEQYTNQADYRARTQQINAYYRFNEAVNLSFNGYDYRYKQRDDERYFTAAINARLNERVNVYLARDKDAHLSYRLNGQIPELRSRLSHYGNHQSYGFDLNHQLNAHTNIGVNLEKNRQRHSWLYQGYLSHRFSDRHSLYAQYNHYHHQQGYQLDWRYRLNSGVDFSLGYRKNQYLGHRLSLDEETATWPFNDDPYFSNNDYFYAQFRLNLTQVPGSGMAFDRYSSRRHGTLIAQIDSKTGEPPRALNSEELTLNINQQPTTARKIAAQTYLIDQIKPGVYEVGMDAKKLPIEYSFDQQQTSRVKISRGAVTKMTYALEQSFGLSGKLSDGSGNQAIMIYHNGELIKTVRSNAYGYYQALGLKKGTYILSAEGYQTQTATISDDFVFDVNLQRAH